MDIEGVTEKPEKNCAVFTFIESNILFNIKLLNQALQRLHVDLRKGQQSLVSIRYAFADSPSSATSNAKELKFSAFKKAEFVNSNEASQRSKE